MKSSRRQGRAYVVIAHGSREAGSNRAFLKVVARLKSFEKGVFGAFLELARPSIPEALEAAVKKGASEVVVVPLLLFPGRHAAGDIPRIVRESARRHRNVRFVVKKALAHHPKFLAFLKEVLR
jgi:sirohydrochlorin ferrochelatase